MKRRTFVALGTAGAAGVAFPYLVSSRQSVDLVLRGGTIADGSGAPLFEGDVAIQGGRIVAVGRVGERGTQEIDVRGLVLAPGFIDIHSHADLSLLVNPNAESRIRQGVTLEVVGQDGGSIGPWSDSAFEYTRDRYARMDVTIDFRDIGGFLSAIDRTQPAVSVASMVGHGTVRGFVVGSEDRPSTATEREQMRRIVANALSQGAVGLSSGLEYTPGSFARTDELVELASELQGTGLPYASHMRNEDDRLMAAVEEAIHVGRMAGVPVQISHLKAQGERNYWKAPGALASIEAARNGGVDVHFDRYPYVAYSTGLTNLWPAEFRAGGTGRFLERLADPVEGEILKKACLDKVALLGSWDAVQITRIGAGNEVARGRRLGELATELGEDPYDLAVRLLAEEGGSVGMIGFGMSEENTSDILAHPLGMICSDGGAYAPYGPLSNSSPHPRGYGSFPRLLGHYVRDQGALSLELAVHKVTEMPALKLGLSDRGRLAEGYIGDVVAFDPDTVADQATFTDPHQYPLGIPHVVVAGVPTIRDGEQTGQRAGRGVRNNRVAPGGS